MNRPTLPVFKDISFNPNQIEEYLPMQPLHTMVFDRFCEDGWTYWSDQIFRRNYWEWRGMACRVVLLRIDLKGFTFTKRQRKNLYRNRDLTILRRPIRIEPMHEVLFERHSRRFRQHRPESIYGFFSAFSSLMPCYGIQFDVFNGMQLVATSFFHVGRKSVAANYCIHEPDEWRRGLGTFTTLKEIEFALEHNRRYYYPGFVYDVPSEFDYKLNFQHLEYFDWWGNWYPLDRLPVRDWRREYEIAPPLSDEDMLEYRQEPDGG